MLQFKIYRPDTELRTIGAIIIQTVIIKPLAQAIKIVSDFYNYIYMIYFSHFYFHI